MSLKQRLSRPGLVLSVLVHVTALSATLIAFSHSEKFDDVQETPPISMISSEDVNQIMKGQKSAKEVHPEAVAKAEEVAPETETQPTPPMPDKSQNEAPPPPAPPPAPMPPVRQVEEPPPVPLPPTPPPPVPLPPIQPTPAPPTPVSVMPPPRPEEPAKETPTPPPVPTPPVRDVAAAPVPTPPKPPKPEPPKPIPPKQAPLPPAVPHPVVAKLPQPHPQPKPRPAEKPKLDQLAKLMEETPTDSTASPDPSPTPAPHPTPAKTHAPSRTTSASDAFDPNDISKLLNSKAPAQRASTGREASHLASLGSPHANAPKMAPSMWAGLDGLMEDQYRSCWSYLGLNTGEKYIPQVRVVYGADGALQGQPVLINPPSDPALQSLADSALRAVRRCNPLKIPEQYAPYYDQWKGRVLRFDPEEMAG